MKALLLIVVVLISVAALGSENFGGVGMVVSERDGLTHVDQVLKGSPADKAGIQADEIIKAVDGKSLVGTTINEAANQIRGPESSFVTLTVWDANKTRERNLNMIRVNLSGVCSLEGVPAQGCSR